MHTLDRYGRQDRSACCMLRGCGRLSVVSRPAASSSAASLASTSGCCEIRYLRRHMLRQELACRWARAVAKACSPRETYVIIGISVASAHVAVAQDDSRFCMRATLWDMEEAYRIHVIWLPDVSRPARPRRTFNLCRPGKRMPSLFMLEIIGDSDVMGSPGTLVLTSDAFPLCLTSQLPQPDI